VNLILFTTSFPYVQGGESNFLSHEVRYLSKFFDRVLVVPDTIIDHDPVDHAGLDVDTSFAQALASKGIGGLFQLALSSKILQSGIREHTFPYFSIYGWRRLLAFSGKAELVCRWVLNLMQNQHLDPCDCLFYTYWFYHATTGIAFAKERYSELRLVTRAHGHDIYEERYPPPHFFPCRLSTVPLVDRIFSASRAGTDHLRNRHPEFSSRINMSLLGVSEPGFQTRASTDGVFRIVSCSMILPVKRIEMIFEVVKHAAKLRSTQKFEWIHIGNGVLRREFQKRVAQEYPPNAKANFPGYPGHSNLMMQYKENPFDVFINLSTSEGTPVSIMEAISCGLPVLATAVGGNKEIVSDQNGLLVSKNPSLDEVASALFNLIDNPDDTQNKRSGSRKVWETHYDAQHNFSEFAQTLKQIRHEPMNV